MAYFVTGATGFIGRFLVTELLDHREGEIFVLVRAGSRHRMEALIRRWGTDRVTPVVGDLSQDGLGVDPAWVAEHRGSVEHFFHLAAIYDMTADDATNETMNVGGTRHAVQLAEALEGHPKVKQVWYPGLASHPQHGIAKQLMAPGYGGVVTFALDATLEQGSKFVDALEIPRIAPSLGGVESLVEQPAPGRGQQRSILPV